MNKTSFLVGAVIGVVALATTVPVFSYSLYYSAVERSANDIGGALRKARLVSLETNRTVHFNLNSDCSWSAKINGFSQVIANGSSIHGMKCAGIAPDKPLSGFDFNPGGHIDLDGKRTTHPIQYEITCPIKNCGQWKVEVLASGLPVLSRQP